jgi:hypothetical protein
MPSSRGSVLTGSLVMSHAVALIFDFIFDLRKKSAGAAGARQLLALSTAYSVQVVVHHVKTLSSVDSAATIPNS